MTREEIYDLLFELRISTFRNEKLIKNSKACGCYLCKKIFKPEDVTEWHNDQDKDNLTGCCPHCGIDSVVSDASGVYITPSLLDMMEKHYFGDDIDNIDIIVTESSLKSIQCKV